MARLISIAAFYSIRLERRWLEKRRFSCIFCPFELNLQLYVKSSAWIAMSGRNAFLLDYYEKILFHRQGPDRKIAQAAKADKADKVTKTTIVLRNI